MEQKGFRITHNLTENELLKTIANFNGLLAPSLAIIREEMLLTRYGDVTLVFDPKVLFDGAIGVNKNDSTNYVYTGDMASPTFPQTEYNFDKTYSNKLVDKLINISNETQCDLADIQYALKKSKEDCSYYLKESLNFKVLFLKSKFEEFNFPPLKSKRKFDIKYDSKELRTFLKENKKRLSEFYNKDDNFEELTELLRKEHVIELEKDPERAKIKQILFDRMFDKDNPKRLSNNTISKYHGISVDLMKPNLYVDLKKMKKKIDLIIRKEDLLDEFELFVEKQVNKLHIEPHILYGKQKLDINEDNILKVMKKANAIGGENTLTFSLAKSKSYMTKRVYNMEDLLEEAEYNIAADQGILEESTSEIKDHFSKINNKIYDNNKIRDSFFLYDFTSETLSKRIREPQDVIAEYKKINIDIDEEIANDVLKLKSKMSEEKVKYFEAKPFRKVELDEIKAIVLPRTASKELKETLKDKGMKVFYFKVNDDEDRKRALNKANKLLLNESYLEKEKQKIKAKRSKGRKLR